MAKKFAKTVYVYRESEGTDSECLLVCEKAEETVGRGEKQRVAVYKLKEVVTVELKAEITALPDKP